MKKFIPIGLTSLIVIGIASLFISSTDEHVYTCSGMQRNTTSTQFFEYKRTIGFVYQTKQSITGTRVKVQAGVLDYAGDDAGIGDTSVYGSKKTADRMYHNVSFNRITKEINQYWIDGYSQFTFEGICVPTTKG